MPDNLGSPSGYTYRVFNGRSRPQNTVIVGGVRVRVKRLIGIATASAGDDFRGLVPLTTSSGYAPTTNGRSPGVGETVSLTYSAKDWRWIATDDSPTRLPGNTPASVPDRMVALPMRNIDQDQSPSVFTLLMYPNTTSGGLNLHRARWDAGTVTGDGNSAGSPRLLNVDPKSGQVLYEAGDVLAPRARTVAWTLDGWAEQISVAARSYIPSADRLAFEEEPWREYFWSSNSGLLYFRPSEAGKSIMASYERPDATTTTGYRTVIGSILSIDDEIKTGGPPGFATYVEAELSDPTGLPIPASAILSVQGVSVRARTAWIDGDRYMQTIATGYRPLTKTS
jgi:hypothetical protein